MGGARLEIDQIESSLRAKRGNPQGGAASGLPRRCAPRKDECANLIESESNILCALIAAGTSKRFDGNKLEAMFNGAMLGTYAATAMRDAGLGACVAVTRARSPMLNSWLAAHDYTLIINDNPDAGLSHSIGLAAQAAIDRDADALLICLADMPFVPPAHLRALAAAPAQGIIASSNDKAAMPPAIFPRDILEKLTKLSGDGGARALLYTATLIEIGQEWLIDIDTRADLAHHSKPQSKR